MWRRALRACLDVRGRVVSGARVKQCTHIVSQGLLALTSFRRCAAHASGIQTALLKGTRPRSPARAEASGENRYMPHFPQLLRDLPPFDGPFDAFKLEAKDCDVLFASYPKGTVIPPHNHDTENVGVITQGELILTRDGKETRYGVGDWY